MNDRLPPNDIFAEESVIGSLLLNGDCISWIENIVKPSDFFGESTKAQYQACVNLRSRREAINQVTVADELKRLGLLEKTGGSSQLGHLIAICPTHLDIIHYANIVYRMSVSRQLIDFGNQIIGIGYNTEPNPSDTVNNISTKFNEFKRSIINYNELISPKDAANILFDMQNELQTPKDSIKWGFRDLDNITGGIYPELIIIGARPSTGKTQLMLDVLENVISRDKKALFVSAEMSLKSLLERKIARELKIDIRRIRRGELDEEILKSFNDLAGIVSEQKVYYFANSVSSQDIYNMANKLKENIGLDVVFVDYLQILKDCWQSSREPKAVLVGRASKVLKSIVNEIGVTVICASQLNREVEHRSEDSRRPLLSDLRESGDIEQDADTVFLLWRDMANIDEDIRNILEIKMAKNRQLGDAPAVKLVWHGETHRYVDAYNPEPSIR